MESRYTYLIILAAALAGPLALSFDRKVAFYKTWKFLFPAMLLPALFYICWDIYFTSIGVWRFNEKYVTGVRLFNLPVEEVMFFFVVPYCCVFIYECTQCYFPSLRKNTWGVVFLQALAILLLIAGVIFFKRIYTGFTFVLTALFIGMICLSTKTFPRFNAGLFLVSFAIVLLPFLLVNGFLTAIPVVIYNDAENTGIRMYTIPIEDVFYGMLLVLMNVVWYEKLRSRKH